MFAKPRCNKVLPTVFDDSLSYYEVLCKLCKRVEELENAKKKYKHSIYLYTEQNEICANITIYNNDENKYNIDKFLEYLEAVEGVEGGTCIYTENSNEHYATIYFEKDAQDNINMTIMYDDKSVTVNDLGGIINGLTDKVCEMEG